MTSDLQRVIHLMLSHRCPQLIQTLGKLQFFLNEIKFLSSSIQVAFRHVDQSANGTENASENRG